MKIRPSGTTARLSRQKWRSPASKASRRWWNYTRSLTCTRTRSNSGKTSRFERATGVFGDESKAEPAGPIVNVKTLHAA